MKFPKIQLLLIGTLLAGALTAQNNGSNQRYNLDLTGSAIVGCDGEIIDLTGNMHLFVHLSTSESGQLNVFTHFNYQNVSGTGQTTQATYRVSESSHLHTINVPSGQSVVTVEDHINIIGEGDAPNSVGTLVIHIVTQPDGSVTANVDHTRSDCQN